MAYLLSLETSSTVCSVALHQDQALLAHAELQIEKSHSALITVLIQHLLEYAKVEVKELSAVAVSGGPGSYTGLRIGASTAKGLCYALDIPMIEVSTLAAMAYTQIQHTPRPEQYLFCPMIDARRMEVYCGIYNRNLEPVADVTPVVLHPDSFAQQLAGQPVLFFGNGAAKFQPLVQHEPNALFVLSASPSAKAVGALAWPKYQAQDFVDVAYYEPYYLKEFYTTAKLV